MLTPKQLLDKAERHLRAARAAADATIKNAELDQARVCHRMFDQLTMTTPRGMDVEVSVEDAPPSSDPFAIERAILPSTFRWR